MKSVQLSQIERQRLKVTLDCTIWITEDNIAGTEPKWRNRFHATARPPEDLNRSYSSRVQPESAKFRLNPGRDVVSISQKQKRLVPSSLLSLSEDLHLFE
jgi:hypothetical protein